LSFVTHILRNTKI